MGQEERKPIVVPLLTQFIACVYGQEILVGHPATQKAEKERMGLERCRSEVGSGDSAKAFFSTSASTSFLSVVCLAMMPPQKVVKAVEVDNTALVPSARLSP